MKTKVLLFVVLSAIATLSFTAVSIQKNNKKEATKTQQDEAPIGGLPSEDKL